MNHFLRVEKRWRYHPLLRSQTKQNLLLTNEATWAPRSDVPCATSKRSWKGTRASASLTPYFARVTASDLHMAARLMRWHNTNPLLVKHWGLVPPPATFQVIFEAGGVMWV